MKDNLFKNKTFLSCLSSLVVGSLYAITLNYFLPHIIHYPLPRWLGYTFNLYPNATSIFFQAFCYFFGIGIFAYLFVRIHLNALLLVKKSYILLFLLPFFLYFILGEFSRGFPTLQAIIQHPFNSGLPLLLIFIIPLYFNKTTA